MALQSLAAPSWAQSPSTPAPSGTAPQPRWIIPARGSSSPERASLLVQPTPLALPQSLPADALDANGVLQCVPFARFVSGIGLRGDAWTWWDHASGLYARGNRPEPGAVLSFPGIERMPLGHVAVVKQVVGARKILIDHANWPNAVVEHGAISRDIQVEDVSPANDWTEVRVQFGEGGPMGSIYPVNGFIYGWTETGLRIAQPRLSPEAAPASPDATSWRMFNAITYFWAFPPAERKKAYAAAGTLPAAATSGRGKTLLVLGLPASSLLNAGALVQPLGVNRLDVGTGGRSGAAVGRYAVQWVTVTR